MFKNLLSLLIISVSLMGCKSEYFKDKIIGFTNQTIKEPPYVWNEFQNGGSISERKTKFEGEIRDPILIEDGIVYIGQDSGTDELFHYDFQKNFRSQLTFRRKEGKKSPIYALRLSRDNWNHNRLSSWIEKGNENNWDIYVRWEDIEFRSKKIHSFVIPTLDSNKINEYLESLQINSNHIFWIEPSRDMSTAYIYRAEWNGEEIQQLMELNLTKFVVSDDWIIFEKKYNFGFSTWYKTRLSTDYSITFINGSIEIPFIKNNLIIWQVYHLEFEKLDLDETQSLVNYFLKFTTPTNDDILLQEIQNNILYLKGRHVIYALDTHTLKRSKITLPDNHLKISYYKNRFVTSHPNGNNTDLYLYEVSF